MPLPVGWVEHTIDEVPGIYAPITWSDDYPTITDGTNTVTAQNGATLYDDEGNHYHAISFNNETFTAKKDLPCDSGGCSFYTEMIGHDE